MCCSNGEEGPLQFSPVVIIYDFCINSLSEEIDLPFFPLFLSAPFNDAHISLFSSISINHPTPSMHPKICSLNPVSNQ